MIPLPTPTNNLSLNMYLPTRSHSKIRIAIRSNSPRRLCHRKRLHVQHCDFPCCRERGGVKDDLEVPGYEPVLVYGVVGFGGDDVEADVVRFTVCEDWNEGGEIEVVGYEVECSVGCYWSEKNCLEVCKRRHLEWES